MRKILTLLFLLGVLGFALGLLPFVFAFPYNDGPNSGPSNVWELIVMISYEWQIGLSFTGIVICVISSIFLFKQRKLK